MKYPERYIRSAGTSWGTSREYWNLKLDCGHNAKIPKEGVNDKFPPYRVGCKKCWYKEKAQKKGS